MPSLDEVRVALGNIDGVAGFLGRKEIKELPNILWENELPEQMVQGFYKNGNGILVCTNSRLIFIDKRLISLKVEDFPLKNISSIQYETGMLLGKITIFTSGNRADISNINKQFVRPFAEYVRAKITPTEQASEKQPKSQSTSNDVIAKLERLASLKEKGILTEDEFLSQKQRLLSEL